MSDQVLNILKLSLLGLVYVFFARVLWAVWSEVKTPRARPVARAQQVPVAARRNAPQLAAAGTHPSPPRDAADAPAGSSSSNRSTVAA